MSSSLSYESEANDKGIFQGSEIELILKGMATRGDWMDRIGFFCAKSESEIQIRAYEFGVSATFQAGIRLPAIPRCCVFGWVESHRYFKQIQLECDGPPLT